MGELPCLKYEAVSRDLNSVQPRGRQLGVGTAASGEDQGEVSGDHTPHGRVRFPVTSVSVCMWICYFPQSLSDASPHVHEFQFFKAFSHASFCVILTISP